MRFMEKISICLCDVVILRRNLPFGKHAIVANGLTSCSSIQWRPIVKRPPMLRKKANMLFVNLLRYCVTSARIYRDSNKGPVNNNVGNFMQTTLFPKDTAISCDLFA